MASFTNRIVAPSVGGSRCAPLPGMVLPKELGSGQLFGGCRFHQPCCEAAELPVETSDEAGPASANPILPVACFRHFCAAQLAGAKAPAPLSTCL
jgi:hypothetical protein